MGVVFKSDEGELIFHQHKKVWTADLMKCLAKTTTFFHHNQWFYGKWSNERLAGWRTEFDDEVLSSEYRLQFSGEEMKSFKTEIFSTLEPICRLPAPRG